MDTDAHNLTHFYLDFKGNFTHISEKTFRNSIADEILLVRGVGELSENILLAVDIGKVYGMGGFILRLTTYVQYGQVAIWDSLWLNLWLGTISN